jgi:hypothetical protein
MRITNISPLGDLDIPLLGRIVTAGETVDVTDEQAAALLAQHTIFEPADKAAKTIAGRHAAARDAGLPAHDPTAEAPAKAPDDEIPGNEDPAGTDKEQAE